MEEKEWPPKGPILPWLIYTHGDAKSKKVQTFSTAPFNNKSYLQSIPELRGKCIEAAHLGWLFLLDEQPDDPDTYSITLWNPFTLKSINLPPLIYHDVGPAMMRCALTSPPTDDACFVFLFFQGRAFSYQYPPRKMDDDSGNSNWVSRRIELQGESAAIFHVVALNGAIYGLASTLLNNRHILVCIEVTDNGSNSFTVRPLAVSMPKGFFSDVLWQSSNFLVESCGSIYLVRVGTCLHNGVHEVRILDLDLDNGIWTKVKCLGDRALLLTRNSCTWCWASPSGVHGNSVYFSAADIVNEGVVCYRLNDCSSTFLPCPKLLNPRYYQVWVMPPHQRLSGRRDCEAAIENTDDILKSISGCTLVAQPEPTQKNYLCELPGHIIELISKHMHLFDYWNFRCTCKMIQSVICAPRWRTNNMFPLFMAFEKDNGLCRVMDPFRDDSHSCILRFSQDYFDIQFSKNGWLLIFDGNYESLLFFNPFTREKGYFPSVKRRFCRIGFSTNPTSSECMTLSHTEEGGEIVIDYIQSGDVNWNTCRFDNNNQGIPFIPAEGSPLYYLGAFYILDQFVGSLGVFELVDGDTRWTVYDRPFARATELHSCHLVECGEELMSVFLGIDGKWIQVFKLNNLKKKWVRVKDLGNQVLFISHVSCFSEITSDRRLRNRIYLPWLIGKRNVFYSLDTGKYHTNDGKYSYKDIFFMKQSSRCCWI